MQLNNKRILIFVGDDYEDLELQYPKYRLREAGAEVVVAGLEAGVIHKGKHGYPQVSEARLADLKAEDFDGLVAPGGWMPDKPVAMRKSFRSHVTSTPKASASRRSATVP